VKTKASLKWILGEVPMSCRSYAKSQQNQWFAGFLVDLKPFWFDKDSFALTTAETLAACRVLFHINN
jgi:hypothetical protein